MFNRQSWYSGEQVQSTVLMQAQRDTAKTMFAAASAFFGGTGSQFYGLAASPISGALSISIGTGSLWQYEAIDPTAWSTLSADTSQWLLQGLVLASQTITGFAAPTISGDSINYLVEAQIQVTDTAAVSTPFYSSANPGNTVYMMESPSRQNVVVFQVKAGTAAPTGTQTTPAADSGWVPLYSVTVDYGETQLQSNDIVLATGAPQFTGFVHNNPNGNTPVYLNPAAQQSGVINISGSAAFGTPNTGGTWITIGNTSSISGSTHQTDIGANSAFNVNVSGQTITADLLYFSDNGRGIGFALDQNYNLGIVGSLTVNGPIYGSAGHAGTDADPYPLSPLNVAMLGGKPASEYALAAGNYITVYSGTPTLATGNAGITGQFTANAPQGTAPFVVQSTTMVSNLNANYVGGYAAGNSSGNVPVSNGTLCANLNAQLLNGLASSAFQPAGNYAQMGSTNTGAFIATSVLESTGGTGSSQIAVGYEATNNAGINGGGAIGYIQSLTQPLALIASSVQTNGPLYVGGGTRQNAYMQDVIASGVVRSGMCVYTVTYGGAGNTRPTPGNGTAWGTYSGMAGNITVAAETVSASQFYLGFRCKVTVASPLTVNFNGLGIASATVYVDGASVGSVGTTNMSSASTTLSAGTHTIDIVYSPTNPSVYFYQSNTGNSHNWGGSLQLFGWIPMSGGQVSSAITAIVPG